MFDGGREVRHPCGDGMNGGAVEGRRVLGLPGPGELHGQAGEGGGQFGAVARRVVRVKQRPPVRAERR